MQEENKDVKVETKGASLFLVDPNPTGRNVVPAEDMFIYVKLTATARNRSVISTDSDNNQNDVTFGEIDFIATDVKYDEAGQPQKDIMGDVKSYATTNYTQIGGIQNTFGSGLLEGFGISSINIKYNTSLVPQVDIDFIDLRGSGLFDVIEQDNRKSPYSIFFKMPYPVFSLTIKGYFGKPVEYCLNMVNWTSKFDPGTGNFNISANFVGFQQAFLADITLGDIIGTVNTDIGKENLQKIPYTQDPVNGTPALDTFIKDLSKLQIDLEKLKFTSDSYNDLSLINTQQKKLEDIRDFIGRPISKDNSGADLSTKYSKKQNSDTVSTSGIKSINLSKAKNYISIRDILFFKSSLVGEVDDFMQDFYDKLEDYKKFYIENQQKLNKNDKIVKNNQINSEVFPFSQNNLGSQIDYNQFILQFSGTDSNGSISLINFIDYLKQPDSILKSNNPKDLEVNNSFDVSTIKITDFSSTDIVNGAKGNKNSEFTDTTLGFALDFRACRMWINDMLITLQEEKEKKEEKTIQELNEKLEKELGFKPTIGTVFEILCNNTQAFVETIFDIGVEAENKNTERQKALQQINPETDLTLKERNNFKSQTIYPFPSIFIKEKGDYVEKYIGSEDVFDINQTNQKQAFPEIEFIEKLVKSVLEKEASLKNLTRQVTRAKRSKSSQDTDNWIPINPIDFSVNPFYFLNVNNASSGSENLKKEFVKILVERYVVLKNYSKFTNVNDYGNWDALLSNMSLVDDKIKDILYTFITDKKYINQPELLISDFYPDVNGDILTQDNFEFGSSLVGGVGNPLTQFVVFGNSTYGKNIIGNNVTLPESISEKSRNQYTGTFINNSNNFNTKYWSTENYNYYSNQSYNVWFETIKNRIVPENPSTTFSIKNSSDITLIDGGVNPNNNGGSNTPIPTDWINLYSKNNNGGNIQLERYLTDSQFYIDQTNDNAKALLLLSTLPFKVFNVLEIPKIASILTLPKYFLLFIGGTLWRSVQSSEPINFSNWMSPLAPPPQKEYINPAWLEFDTQKRGEIENSLLNLPTETKNNFINYFTKWVTNEFFSFEELVINYSKEEDITPKYNIGTTLAGKDYLGASESLIIIAPDVFNVTNTQPLSISGINTYLKSFIDNIKSTLTDKKNNSQTETQTPKDNTKNLEQVKQSAYYSIKNVYDRWVAGNTRNELSFNACGEPGKPLFDYFRFIDRGFNDIGGSAVINLQSVISASENMTTNLYFYMSNILRHSNFLFQIMPNYINYKDPDEVSDMFKPITNVSDRNTSSGPTYLCIYAGGTSQVLDIDEQSRYTFKNDGFNFDLPPSDIASEKTQSNGENFNLVAFRVAFGAENQTIFKSVSLNQQEHKDTSEYFATLTDLIDKRGGTSRSYQGTDLYKMFRARSYTCNVEALGCMNIQPMMYFQLDNVPFFEGAYMILNVTHNISPNHMTTSFTGVRQSKYITPVVDKMTTFLDISLDETIDSEPIPERSLIRDGINFNVGIPEDKSPDEAFNFEQITVGTLVDLGVTENTTEIVQSLKSNVSQSDINTNSQVTMFLANCMTSSKNFTQTVETWNDKNSTTNKELYTDINNPFGNRRGTDDAYIYRKRGYIPIIGKDQYERFSNDNSIAMSELTGDSITTDVAVKISIWRWQNYPYSKSYQNNDEIAKKQKENESSEKILTNTQVAVSENQVSANQKSIIENNKKIIELRSQEDKTLVSEENYPPSVYADGGTANNFAQTLNLLTLKGGENTEDGFDNFTKVLRVFAPNNSGGNQQTEESLLGTTTGGNVAKLSNGNIYQSKSKEEVLSEKPNEDLVQNTLTGGESNAPLNPTTIA